MNKHRYYKIYISLTRKQISKKNDNFLTRFLQTFLLNNELLIEILIGLTSKQKLTYRK